MKKYILTEEQRKNLFELKREERKVIIEIKERVDNIKKNLSESKQENGIISILKPYYKKGKISKFVAESLINDGVNKKLLISSRDKL